MSNIDNYTDKLEISYSGNKNSAVTVVNSLTITQRFIWNCHSQDKWKNKNFYMNVHSSSVRKS